MKEPRELPFNFALSDGHGKITKGVGKDAYLRLDEVKRREKAKEEELFEALVKSTGVPAHIIATDESFSNSPGIELAESFVAQASKHLAQSMDAKVFESLNGYAKAETTIDITKLSDEELSSLNFALMIKMKNIALRIRQQGIQSVSKQDYDLFTQFMEIAKESPVETLLTFAINNAGRVPTDGAVNRMVGYMHQMTVPAFDTIAKEADKIATHMGNSDTEEMIKEMIFNISSHKLVRRCRAMEINYPDTISLSVTLAPEDFGNEEEGEELMQILYNYVAETKEEIGVTEIEIVFSNKVVF